jgi:hypothetical protein
MTKRTTGLSLAAIALIGLLAACGSTASSSAASAPASQAASAAPSEAASEAPSSEPSFDIGSFALPSFVLPSNAKDLEALLPNELCGATVQKLSFAGADFEGMADPEFAATLSGLGKTAADVSMAIAAPLAASGCAAGVFRINGADTGRLQEVFLQAAEDEGSTYTSGSLGGKNVSIITASGETGKQYVYFKGDAVFFAQAPDDAAAGEILAALP